MPLIQAEVEKNHHVEPCPFGVNAGSISIYINTPDNKTLYLSKLRIVNEVLIANRNSSCRTGVIEQAKIEVLSLIFVKDDVKVKMIRRLHRMLKQ